MIDTLLRSLTHAKTLLGGIAAILSIASVIPYAISILQHRIQPHVFSWFLWFVIAAIAGLAQLSAGAGPGVWVTLTWAAASLGITVIVLTTGNRVSISLSDWLTLFAALSALPIWLTTHQPLVATLITSVINAIAFLITLRKLAAHPKSEDPIVFIIDATRRTIWLCSMANYTLTTTLYPVTALTLNVAVLLLIAKQAAASQRCSTSVCDRRWRCDQ